MTTSSTGWEIDLSPRESNGPEGKELFMWFVTDGDCDHVEKGLLAKHAG